jgi:hypothetical protein
LRLIVIIFTVSCVSGVFGDAVSGC